MKINYDLNMPVSQKGALSRRMMFLCASLIFSSITLFFFALPEYRKMEIMRMEIDLKDKNLSLKRDVVNKVVDFNKSSDEILSDRELEKIYNLVPNKSKLEDYIANVDNLAKINLLLMEKIDVRAKASGSNKPATPNDVQTSYVTFGISGDFVNFMSFLSYFERSIPMADVSSVEIKREDEKKMVTYNVTFLYNYKQ